MLTSVLHFNNHYSNPSFFPAPSYLLLYKIPFIPLKGIRSGPLFWWVYSISRSRNQGIFTIFFLRWLFQISQISVPQSMSLYTHIYMYTYAYKNNGMQLLKKKGGKWVLCSVGTKSETLGQVQVRLPKFTFFNWKLPWTQGFHQYCIWTAFPSYKSQI